MYGLFSGPLLPKLPVRFALIFYIEPLSLSLPCDVICFQVFHKGCEVVTLIMGFDELLAAREKEEV